MRTDHNALDSIEDAPQALRRGTLTPDTGRRKICRWCNHNVKADLIEKRSARWGAPPWYCVCRDEKACIARRCYKGA